MTAQKEDELTFLKKESEKKFKELEGKLDTEDSALADLQAQAVHNSYDSDRQLTEEEIKELKLREKVDKENIKEIKKEENLDAEKKRQLENARKAAYGSNPIPGATNISTPTDNTENLERQQEIADRKQEVEEDIAQAIEDAKSKRDERIAKAKEGPTGLLAIFSNTIFFIILGIIDSAVSAIPVVGDIIMAVVLAVVWFIPALLLFDLFLYVRILFFITIDWIVGTFGGTVANVVPVIGDAGVDFIPEFLVLLTHNSPAALVRKAYFEKVPALVARIREKYQLEVQQIKERGRNSMKYAMKRLQGHFAGVAGEGRKVLFMLLFILTGVMTQVFGWFGIDNGRQITFTAFYLLVLFVIKSINLIGSRELLGIGAFLGWNILFRYILRADSYLSRYIGSGDALLTTVIFIVISILLIFKIAKPESMTNQRMVGILAFVVLALSLPYMVGYLSSDQFAQDMDQRRVASEQEIDNFNFWERAIAWYGEMQARGRGEYIATVDQENVHEYIGLELKAIEATRSEYLEGRPVQLNIEFETGSKEDLLFLTTCDALNQQAAVFPETAVVANELYTPLVRCVFENGLPKGTHLVTVNAFYDYASQIEIPLMFMTESRQQIILDGQGNPETYEGGVDNPRTSSGPVNFGVSNRLGNENFEQPLVYDPENPNQFPKTIILRLENSLGAKTTQGEMRSISKMEFDLPAGLNIGACDFQGADTSIITPSSTANGRWIVDITSYYQVLDLDDYITCDLFLDEQYINEYLPSTGYNVKTMFFNIEYTYGLSQQKPVTIV